MRSFVIGALAVGLSACGGTVAGGIDAAATDSGVDSAVEGGGSDAGGTCPNVDESKTIYGPCFQRITVVKYDSGFGPPPPQGSECNTIGDTWDLDLTSGKLDRTSCTSLGPNQPNKASKVSSTMLAGALAGVKTALQNVIVVGDTGCISDGPTLTLTVHTTTNKNVIYGDSKVSACMGTPVTGIDGVVTALMAK
jgi:hypothetical protein